MTDSVLGDLEFKPDDACFLDDEGEKWISISQANAILRAKLEKCQRVFSELKPCPFCGAKRVSPLYLEKDEVFVVFCSECATDGPYEYSEKEAIKKWNTRSGAPESKANCTQPTEGDK